MTFFQIFSSIVGIGFLFGGIKVYKGSKIWSSIALLIGIILMNQVLFGEVSKSDDKQNELKNLQLKEISRISILPSQKRKVLRADTIEITSENEIKRIQECLSRTRETLSQNQNVDWGCILQIQRKDQTNIFTGISKNKGQTILEIYSRGEYGTNYGSMINNELGFILEKIIKKEKASSEQQLPVNSWQ